MYKSIFMQESVSNIDNQGGDSVFYSASCNQSDSVSPAENLEIDYKRYRGIAKNLFGISCDCYVGDNAVWRAAIFSAITSLEKTNSRLCDLIETFKIKNQL